LGPLKRGLIESGYVDAEDALSRLLNASAKMIFRQWPVTPVREFLSPGKDKNGNLKRIHSSLLSHNSHANECYRHICRPYLHAAVMAHSPGFLLECIIFRCHRANRPGTRRKRERERERERERMPRVNTKYLYLTRSSLALRIRDA